MNPLSSPTTPPPPHWKLRSPPLQRPPSFSQKLDEFRQDPKALDEDQLNDLVEECMSNGDDEPLGDILAQPHLRTLHIRPYAGDERAWWTLLSAMPEACSISGLTLCGNRFDRDTGPLLLQAMSRMPELNCLHFDACDWNLALGELTCPALPKLQEFCVEETTNAFSLLALVLDVPVSQPTGVAVISNPGMKEEHHAALAKLLSAQAKAKLSDLSLRDLLAGEGENEDSALRDRPLANVLAHYTGFLAEKTATLKYLNFSLNPLGPLASAILREALSANTTPTNLVLDECWRARIDSDHWGCVGELVKLPRFVAIGLDGNDFPEPAKALFAALAKNEGLQQLNLRNASMDPSIWEALATGLKTMNLTTLHLPAADDHSYGGFLDTMQINERLHTLRVPDIERQRSSMPAGLFDATYRNYLEFVACVHRNWRNWPGAVESVKDGMEQVLAHMGIVPGQDALRYVPVDIARHAASWAIEMNGAQTQAVSGLNKHALPKD